MPFFMVVMCIIKATTTTIDIISITNHLTILKQSLLVQGVLGFELFTGPGGMAMVLIANEDAWLIVTLGRLFVVKNDVIIE